jgi:hypothetical protein
MGRAWDYVDTRQEFKGVNTNNCHIELFDYVMCGTVIEWENVVG